METQTSSSQTESFTRYHFFSSQEEYSTVVFEDENTKITPPTKDMSQRKDTYHDTAVSTNSNEDATTDELHCLENNNWNEANSSTNIVKDIVATGSKIMYSVSQGKYDETVTDASAHPLLPISLLCSFILEKQHNLEQEDIQTQRLLEYVCSEIQGNSDSFTLTNIIQILINELVTLYQNSIVLKVFEVVVSRVFGILSRKRGFEYQDLRWSYYRFHMSENSLNIKERVYPEQCLVSFKDIFENERDAKMDGPRSIFYVFKTILKEEKARCLVPLFLQEMKETKLPNSVGDKIIDQVLRTMKNMELQDIQRIFYKLLQFANTSCSAFDLFFTKFVVFIFQLERHCEVLDHYDSISASQDFGIRLDSHDSSTLLSFESSILKQFIFTCRNESSVGKKFLKLFRKNVRVRNTIGLAFLLVVAHNRSLCEEVFQTLIFVLQSETKAKAQFYAKSRDIQSLAFIMFPKMMERKGSLFWSEMLECLEKTTRAVVDKWNFLMAPLIEFCIYALDHEELFHSQEYGLHGLYKLCDIIQILFDSETGSQAPILDAIFRNLLNQRIDTDIGIQTIIKMESECLTNILNESFSRKVKQFFLEDFKYIRPYQGLRFIQCMLPILRLNSELCNAAIVTLKKCLAFNQSSRRKLALDGLLIFASMSETNREIEITVDELPLLLLRALSQNYMVRRNVYRKLTTSCFTHMRQSTCRHIFSIIEEHWKRYLDVSMTPIIQFALCVEYHTGFVVEPISELLQCYLRLYTLNNSVSEKDLIVQELCNSIIATDLLDLGISGQEIDLRIEEVARRKRNISRCFYHVVNILILELVCKEEFLMNSHEIELLTSLFQWKDKLELVMKSAGMAFEVDTLDTKTSGQRQSEDKPLLSSQSFKRNGPKGFHLESTIQVEKWNSIIDRIRQLKQMSPPNLGFSSDSLFAQSLRFLHKLVADEIFNAFVSDACPPKDVEQTCFEIPLWICGSWNDFEFRCSSIKSRPVLPLQNINYCLQWLSTCSLSMEEKQKVIVNSSNQLKILHPKEHLKMEKEESPQIRYLLETVSNTILNMLKESRWNETNELLNILVFIKALYHNNSSVLQYLETFSNETVSTVAFEDGHCLYKLQSLTWRTLESKISCLVDISNVIHRKLGDIGESIGNSAESWDGDNLLIGSEAVEQLLQNTTARSFELFEDVRWILKTHAIFLQTNKEACLETLCDVIQPVIRVLKNLARSHVMQWSICQSILKSLILSYKVLHDIFSIHLHHQLKPADRTCQLANFVLTEYTPVIYLFIPYINQYETSNLKKVVKESRWIPQLIFSVERLETVLIRLSKRTNTPEILRGWKRSTARDFKILDEQCDKENLKSRRIVEHDHAARHHP
ncbi:hypothetical protein GpartN1_g716.t1 [Galdieria partita]|uniref:FANCI solenoid 4 domain-containing protein n=1 Tax=Galdieria partita TaxID=83374 RepID=A0A9C7PR11_9RHOD|nr:hypothetical protein GpartN1_g716.t1 [Galdieria partita]